MGKWFKEGFPEEKKFKLGSERHQTKSRMNVFPTGKNSMCKDPGVGGCTVHFSQGTEKNTNLTGAERLKGEWEEGRLEK